jgi:hypothetical protein
MLMASHRVSVVVVVPEVMDVVLTEVVVEPVVFVPVERVLVEVSLVVTGVVEIVDEVSVVVEFV